MLDINFDSLFQGIWFLLNFAITYFCFKNYFYPMMLDKISSRKAKMIEMKTMLAEARQKIDLLEAKVLEARKKIPDYRHKKIIELEKELINLKILATNELNHKRLVAQSISFKEIQSIKEEAKSSTSVINCASLIVEKLSPEKIALNEEDRKVLEQELEKVFSAMKI